MSVLYQATAPFLHIGALATVTAIGWLVAGYVVRRERSSKSWLVFHVNIKKENIKKDLAILKRKNVTENITLMILLPLP